MTAVAPATLDRLKQVVGAKGWSTDPNTMAPHLTEWRDRWRGATPLLLRPGSTDEVAGIVRICAETRTPLVVQGGNTGLVGGQIPDGEVLVSMGRMDRIRAVDPVNNTLTAEAGCILQSVQDAAAAAGRLFPLSLASEGTAQIGGLISTNAGGHQVVRYGTMRALVLGLEAVTPDGRVWDGLRALRKDNTGYDLKQLLIGAEGTLGIVTAAVLRLAAEPRVTVTACVALRDPAAGLDLLAQLQGDTGDAVSAFELLPAMGLTFVQRHVPDARLPFDPLPDWSVLIACGGGDDLSDTVEETLSAAIADGLVTGAVIAANRSQADALWRLRTAMSEVQKFEGGSLKHDIAVPVSRIPDMLSETLAAVENAVPGIRPVPFGHVGDGNLHFNFSQPDSMDRAAFLARRDEVARIVHDIAHRLGGSISAEHGLGRAKRDEILRYKSAVELDLMRAVKRALDPDNLMNPGKVL